MGKNVIVTIENDTQESGRLQSELTAGKKQNYEIIIITPADDVIKKIVEFRENSIHVSALIIEYQPPEKNLHDLLSELQELMPDTPIILLCDKEHYQSVQKTSKQENIFRILQKPWETENMQFTVAEAVKNTHARLEKVKHTQELRTVKEKAAQEKKILDKLSGILNEKIEELEDQQKELEQISKEFNATTIEKILIEQEAARTNKTLSILKNSLKNNLFVRSVLHSIVNMLQIQFSIGRRENSAIEKLRGRIKSLLEEINCRSSNSLILKKELYDLDRIINDDLLCQRKKTDLNLHRTLFGYVKAVQRTLMGETVHFTSKPCYLPGILKKVKEKYHEILETGTGGKKIDFIVGLHTPDIYLRILDFSLINIIENLLTNSIRKLLETMDSGSKWIKITSRDERIDNQDYTVLEWKDNGPGVQNQRKKTIFEGDSDKEEEGDHGIGLSDIKTTIEAVGGFIREIGAYGKGATFVVGFPKVYEVSEPDLDGDGKNEVRVEFPPTLASKNVLIIAGDGDMLDNYMNFFKTSGLQGVRGADSCKQALGFVLDHKFTPNLLIADIDGIEEDSYILLDELKANALRVPTIILSEQLFQKNGYSRDDLVRLEQSGVGDVLEKPIDFALLSRLAQKHLSAVEPGKMLHQEKRDNSQRN